jgi:thiamine pyrophosphate-dependent acetolactate synthase large subunit-like protein
MRYPVEVPLVGDARETLRLLLPRLSPNMDDSFRIEIIDGLAVTSSRS